MVSQNNGPVNRDNPFFLGDQYDPGPPKIYTPCSPPGPVGYETSPQPTGRFDPALLEEEEDKAPELERVPPPEDEDEDEEKPPPWAIMEPLPAPRNLPCTVSHLSREQILALD